MHTPLHTEYVRAAQADLRRGQARRDEQRTFGAKAPPGRPRRALAYILASAAGRVDRDVARRAVA